MANEKQNDGVSIFSDDNLEQVDKPKPSFTEQLAMILIPFGIVTTIMPFAVKFLGGLPSMSDVMVLIAVFGVVLFIIGAILAIISKSKNAA